MTTFNDAIKELKELKGKITLSQHQAGRVIYDYLGNSKKPMREKMLRKLCKAVGIDRATAYRWMKVCRDFAMLPEPVVERAEKAFKKITTPIREKLLEVYTANPGATAEKIVELTEAGLKPKPEHAVEKIALTPKRRQEKLFDYAENLYRNVDPKTRERELQSLVNELLTYFSVPTKEVA